MARVRDSDDKNIQVVRAASEDGLSELMLGLAFITSSGIYLIGSALPQTTAIRVFAPLFQLVCWLGFLVFGLKRLRVLIAVPRAGDVGRKVVRTRWVFLVFTILGAAVLAVVMSHPLTRALALSSTRTLAPAAAVLMAVIFVAGGIRYGLTHCLYLGAFSLAVAAWVYAAGLGSKGTLWVLVWLGTAMALSGAFHLGRFIRLHSRRTPN